MRVRGIFFPSSIFIDLLFKLVLIYFCIHMFLVVDVHNFFSFFCDNNQ